MSLEPKVLLQVKHVLASATEKVEEPNSGAIDTEERQLKAAAIHSTTDDSGDVMLLNGKEINIASDPSDSAIEAMMTVETGGQPFVNYKSLADAVVASIKQQIWNIHHPTPTPPPPGDDPDGPEGPGDDPVTPGDDPEEPGDEGEEAEIPSTVNHTLTRKNTSQNTKTITVGTTATTVKLTNSVDGKDYYYTLTSTDSSSHSVKLTYLDNGRLVVQGDKVKIVATKNQDDDIILIGDYCEVYTNSGNDKVRVGNVKDSDDSVYERSKDYGDGPEDTTQSDFNYINLGSGDDYVQLFGGYTEIVGGSGNDKMLVAGVKLSQMEGFGITTDSVEFVRSTKETDPNSFNGKYDGAGQGGYGDCKFLSALNSIADNWNQYIKITKSGTSYTVKFLKSGSTKTVTASDLAESKNAKGDIDFVLVEIAFRKLITAAGYNMDNDATGVASHDDKMLGSSDNNFLISKFLFGRDTGSSHACYYLNDTTASYLLDELNAGRISNFVVGTNDADSGDPDNNQLGIYFNHAYAVKGGVKGQYVLLCNPWDGNDIIKLDWTDFLKYYDSINLFGNTYDNFVAHFNVSGAANDEEHDPAVIAITESYVMNNIFADDPEELKKLVKE